METDNGVRKPHVGNFAFAYSTSPRNVPDSIRVSRLNTPYARINVSFWWLTWAVGLSGVYWLNVIFGMILWAGGLQRLWRGRTKEWSRSASLYYAKPLSKILSLYINLDFLQHACLSAVNELKALAGALLITSWTIEKKMTVFGSLDGLLGAFVGTGLC